MLVKSRPFFRRALFTVGLLLRHFDFTDKDVIQGLEVSMFVVAPLGALLCICSMRLLLSHNSHVLIFIVKLNDCCLFCTVCMCERYEQK